MTNFSDTLIQGLIVTLFGVGIVFVVLILLQYVLKSMELIFYRRNKKKNPAVTQVPAVKVEDTPVPQTAAFEVSEDDEQLIAVITAAVVSCLGGSSNIVVRNIRRVDDYTPVWGKVSRTEQMASRF